MKISPYLNITSRQEKFNRPSLKRNAFYPVFPTLILPIFLILLFFHFPHFQAILTATPTPIFSTVSLLPEATESVPVTAPVADEIASDEKIEEKNLDENFDEVKKDGMEEIIGENEPRNEERTDPEKLDPRNWKKDGFPFFYPKEKETLFALWSELGRLGTPTPQASVGFISLERQSEGYKGQRVRIEGRLLRTERIAPTTPEEGAEPDVYESWVLLDDERQIPARLLTRKIPDGFVIDRPSSDGTSDRPLRTERITAWGIYYRQASYNGGDDFYNSPILVGETFQILAGPREEGSSDGGNASDRTRAIQIKTGLILLLFLLWILVRFVLLRRHRKPSSNHPSSRPAPTTDSFQFNDQEIELLKEHSSRNDGESEPSSDDPPQERRLAPALLLLAALAINGEGDPGTIPTTPTPAAVSEEKAPEESADESVSPLPMNREFWETITEIDPDALFAADSEESTPFRKNLSLLLDRLDRNIPIPLLHQHLRPELWTDETAVSEFLTQFPENFGSPLPFHGKVIAITPFPLSDGDSPTNSLTPFRIEIQSETGSRMIVYATRLPKKWGEDGSKGIGRTTKGVGIYFDRLPLETSGENEATPILVSPHLGDFSDETALGRLGFDLSLFDDIPARSPSALDQTTDSETRKALLENFRLTPKDRLPFYSLLSAVAKAPAGTLREEWSKQNPASMPTVVDLFNRPERCQGELVSLTGHLRRARKVLVTDPEIRELFGRDHYYELYLFTNDSQDYPVLFCVPECFDLNSPAGLEEESKRLGSGKDYREEVSVTGFLYKPWAFQIDSASSLNDAGSSSGTGKDWIAVPLMIGGDVVWRTDPPQTTGNGPKTIFFGVALLAFITLVYFRLRPKSKPIIFRLPGEDSPIPRR